ncbi:ACP S-malonyltransferase [Enterobacillus tribolii]|uniref:[acyl-carrier-protein] S-malonyltransferase n=1 Tax=Enterobacillus tribolii TaxID=1487935 RepID=A0A370R0T0_9GAMM|nr:ACP S-malonyltransferase [Enterobacillus tribolii]MBW7982905.1 [acyl-carrier-protein] S-malonyltransferase [Enterobacillus tribolii]RDK95533.1 trans-AT polyketide synthase/acyltransferase/oxidoreductase domain-containing protein [Enterobacillus tribolii]
MQVLLFPGQGSQFKGMGQDLWAAYPALAEEASEILGYSIRDLCLNDPQNQLGLTHFTQPALYVVNALHFYRWQESGIQADALAGHSLGEYSALLAGGAFDFATGLRLVQKRGQLMSEASGGGMAAVLGMRADALQDFLREQGLETIDIANQNSPNQSVIAGDIAALERAEQLLRPLNVNCVRLNVSAAFHSRHMRQAQQEFALFLREFELNDPVLPVIANVTARPYQPGEVASLLAQQIASPVRWTESIRYLMGMGEFDYVEMGADPKRMGGRVLGKMVDEIRRTETAIVAPPPQPVQKQQADEPRPGTLADDTPSPGGDARRLGSAVFRQRYGLKYAYIAGAMFRATSSVELVVRMGKAGMIGYFGAGGLSLPEIESAIQRIQNQLSEGQSWGVNLLANHDDPEQERATVELFLKYGVRYVEAAAFMQMTLPLALFRIKGLYRDAEGKVCCRNHVLGKVSRLEVAEAFMSPIPAHLINILLAEGAISAGQAEMARETPMSHEICVEADSGGHTDGGIPTILLPTMLQLRRTLAERYQYQTPLCIGLGGGIGAPEAAAAAFAMGADFILTGSINQCSVESGATEMVKALLQDTSIHDMAYAPAGDMFEFGSRVQVLKKKVLFPMRANRLYALYTHYDSIEAIPEAERSKLERTVFKRSLDEVWEECLKYLKAAGRDKDVALASANPKVRMARIFRWYFSYSTLLSFSNSPDDIVNYQVQTGPAIGAFNQWVKGTDMEHWQQRHVDNIALSLLDATARHLCEIQQRLFA